MEKSIVRVSMRDENGYDCSYAVVTKEGGGAQKSVIVILRGLECGVFDYDRFRDDEDFRFLLLKQYSDEGDALKDFYKIVGKMCHKSMNSKYFLNPRNEYNRIKFVDFRTETMDFDYDDEELSSRFEAFKDFVSGIRQKIAA